MAEPDGSGSDGRQRQDKRRRRASQIADENTISIAQRAQSTERDTPAQRPPAQQPRPASGPRAESTTSFDAVPEGILDRYYRIGGRYFLDNGEFAFENHGNRLSTKSDNTEIARDMVDFVRHNGAKTIAVTGTDRFRFEAWAAAQRLGIAVEGFTPDEHQEKQLVRQMAKEGVPHRPSSTRDREEDREAEARSSSAPPAAAAAQREASTQQSPQPEPSKADRRPRAAPEPGPERTEGIVRGSPQDRLYHGKLLDFGAENYKRSPHEDMSYFVQIDTPRGPIELWGKDLERALRESKTQPKKGDEVAVLQTGQKPVTVQASVYDEAGAYVGKEEKGATFNEWQVEKREFIVERHRLAAAVRDLRVTPQEGTRQHPQLAGTYAYLREAELFAEHLSKYPDRQRRFIELAREEVAQRIERGESLPTTRLKTRDRDRDLQQERVPA